MNPSEKSAYQGAVQALALSQRLTIKAVSAKNLQSLIFIILNDTYHLFPYDRAVLWRIKNDKAEMLGVSGQATFTTESELVKNWKLLVASLPNPHQSKVLTAQDFPSLATEWMSIQPKTGMKAMWVPLFKQPEETVGIWFERWNEPETSNAMQDNAKVLEEHLIPGYLSAWDKLGAHSWKFTLKDKLGRKQMGYLFLALLLLLFFVRIPLRVSAPCEVVGKDPYVVASPLEGIIAEITVKPGQNVKKGDLLYTYDKRVPLQELAMAEKEVEVLQAETNRLMVLGVNDPHMLAEMAVAKAKLQKGLVDLEFAKYRIGLLTSRAPADGIAIVEKPDEWRGRPVKIGEKVLEVSNPNETKVRIWIPESDAISFNQNEPIHVFLDPNPLHSYEAMLTYISPEIVLSDQRIASFMAEANWVEPPVQSPLGLRGTAIIYGDRVSLFYYIMRKPLSTLRRLLGV